MRRLSSHVLPCGLVQVHRHFRGACCLHNSTITGPKPRCERRKTGEGKTIHTLKSTLSPYGVTVVQLLNQILRRCSIQPVQRLYDGTSITTPISSWPETSWKQIAQYAFKSCKDIQDHNRPQDVVTVRKKKNKMLPPPSG
jgi:hypothetical protein